MPASAKDRDQSLRKHLLELLEGASAHVSPQLAVAGFPAKLRSVRPPGLPHSGWELLEHMRIAQRDILDFSTDKDHVSPPWPDGYWPSSSAPSNVGAWKKSVDEFLADLNRIKKLVRNPRTDLFAKIPQGDGQTILREAMLVADHNSYHVGELVLVRRALGAWK